MTQGQFVKRSKTGYNTEFSFSWIEGLRSKSSLLFIPCRERGSMPFPTEFAQSEAETAPSRALIQVTDSTFKDDNRFVKRASFLFLGGLQNTPTASLQRGTPHPQ